MVAQARIAAGQGSATDTANVNYAISKGWKPTATTPSAPPTPSSSSSTAPTTPVMPNVSSTTDPTSGTGTTPTPAPTTPTAPVINPVTAAEDAYKSSMAITPGEKAAQEDLDRLNTSTRQAYTGTDNKVMPLEFITGQKQSIQSQALDLAEPLNTKLARLQAERLSQADAAKFSLERADKTATAAAAAAAEKNKAINVGDNIVQYNPTSGKYEAVYSAPKSDEGFTLGEGQKRFDSSGKEIAAGADKSAEVRESGGYLYQQQKDGTWKVVGGKGTNGLGKIVNINGTDYIQNSDGTFTTPSLPNSPASQQKVQALQDKVSLIDSLLTSKGLAGSVGAYGIGRFTPFTADKTERKEFAAGVNQLINQETINTLLDLKQQGGTLGALSDQERILLQSATSKIGSWMIRDSAGNPTGEFEVSESAFKDELNRLKELTQKAIDRAGGDEQSINESDPQVQYLRSQGLTDEEIRKIGFNQDPGKSENGLDVSKVVSAIGQFESGGNYQAIGPATSSGDRAYGKYQIMGNNIPSWSKEVLGRSITVKEFLSNQALQDQIAAAKIGQYVQKYGTVEDAASMWFSGRPLAKAGNAKDVIGTTVPQYARNVRALYDRSA